MGRIDFEGPIEFVHHAAKPEDRREGFPVDAEQLAQVAEEREVGIGVSFIRRDRPFPQGLSLLKMGHARGAIGGSPPMLACFEGLFRQLRS